LKKITSRCLSQDLADSPSFLLERLAVSRFVPGCCRFAEFCIKMPPPRIWQIPRLFMKKACTKMTLARDLAPSPSPLYQEDMQHWEVLERAKCFATPDYCAQHDKANQFANYGICAPTAVENQFKITYRIAAKLISRENMSSVEPTVSHGQLEPPTRSLSRAVPSDSRCCS